MSSMNNKLSTYLLISLLTPSPSSQRPVAVSDPKIKKIVEDDPEPIYFNPDELVDQNLVEEREGVDADQQVQALSPESAADTLRKINPLTIGNQVSEMLRKNYQKANLANKSKTAVADSQRNERGETSQEDQNPAVSFQRSEAGNCPDPGYVKQPPPKIVNKPHNNDYGYSVIVLAGEAAHLPLKGLQDKDTKGKKLEYKKDYVNIQGQGVFKTGEAEERVSSLEKNNSNKKEVRVSKQFSKNPEFPVYDEDLNFAQDPFHGLLDKNYWSEPGKENEQNPALPLQDLTKEGFGLSPHRVLVRSDEETDEETRSEDEEAPCGNAYGNSTATNSEGDVVENGAEKVSCGSYKNANLTNAALVKRSVNSLMKS